MECPACGSENPESSAYCLKCTEALNATRKRDPRLDRPDSPQPPAPQKEPPARRAPTGAGAPRTEKRSTETHAPIVWNWKPFWLLGGLGVVGVLVIGVSVVLSTLRRPTPFEQNGGPLTHYFFEYAPFHYYAIEKRSGEVWTERNGQLDQELAKFHTRESGGLTITTISSTVNRQILQVENTDWSSLEEGPEGNPPRTLSADDPSLAPATIVLDKQGYALTYNGSSTWRLGKTLHFLVPVLPPGIHRDGDRWTESVEWVDRFDDWDIQWTAVLDWSWQGFVKGSSSQRARLLYQGSLTPSVKRAPHWARSLESTIQFAGRAEGQALYDPAARRIVANTFTYDGALTLPLADLGAVPVYQHKQRYRRQPGRIVIPFKNQIDIGIP